MRYTQGGPLTASPSAGIENPGEKTTAVGTHADQSEEFQSRCYHKGAKLAAEPIIDRTDQLFLEIFSSKIDGVLKIISRMY